MAVVTATDEGDLAGEGAATADPGISPDKLGTCNQQAVRSKYVYESTPMTSMLALTQPPPHLTKLNLHLTKHKNES